MNKLERRAVISLASIMSLRMIGLFMILPVFSLYAEHLQNATPFLIGTAMGIYGLTQALFQIPFGMLSDHIGRKKIIALGLCIFALGSVVAATTDSITGMIIGRGLQGAGAVGSTIMALIADLTREDQRTKAMAITGMSIGVSFSFAFILGPLLINWVNFSGIFWLAAVLSLIAIVILITVVPTSTHSNFHPETEADIHQFSALLIQPDLFRLNAGIFILHAVLTASFIAIPISLASFGGLHGKQQWLLYLPVLLLAFIFTIPMIVLAEKKKKLRQFFISAIVMLGFAECILWTFTSELWLQAFGLLLFFTGFTVLEAFLPSLVSKTAPAARKGTALGIYSCSQFLGIFVGGTLGGWLYGIFGLTDVYLFCIMLTILWAAIAFKMKNPQHQTLKIPSSLTG